MKILRKKEDLFITIYEEQDSNIDLGWEENFKEFEDESLRKIINPIENYETVRYIHKEYPMPTYTSLTQNDIWYYFYFLTTGDTYNQNYETIGLSLSENAKMLKQTTESFFRLEFYKTPNNVLPNRMNRRLVMTRNLSLPLGEKYFNTLINDNIFLPIFNGSNYKNKENMYLFWFKDDTAFNETELTGNTFWMTAKFYNADNGDIIDFVTSDLNTEVDETINMYYKVEIERNLYTYQVFLSQYNNRIGNGNNNPIKFYQKR